MKFVEENNLDAFNADTTAILYFLTHRFKKDVSILNTTRSAIVLISRDNISQDRLIIITIFTIITIFKRYL